jgi:bifunctional non-homologous end joining protein LigD
VLNRERLSTEWLLLIAADLDLEPLLWGRGSSMTRLDDSAQEERTRSTEMSLRFVVHEHHASHLHYDFRLEWEGVLRSWAVPKGPTMNPSEKRLAISVEDHPLAYGDFEGVIPAGQYGAGVVVIWDCGTYEVIDWKQDKITFVLKGKKLKGAFTLASLKQRGKGNEWLLIKRKDEYAVADWKLCSALDSEKELQLQKRIPPYAVS